MAATPKPSRSTTAASRGPQPRRAAVLGGNRIPFARSNGAYGKASNQDMLTATIDGLVARYGLAGERLGEVAAGAVLKHSRDFNLTRESVLGSALDPTTPAYDVQQACGTGLETTILVANKIALGQIESGVAGGTDTASDAPIAVNEELRRALIGANNAKTTGQRLKALTGIRPGQLVPEIPRNVEPRTGLSMGEHMAITGQGVGHHPRGPGRADRAQPPATSPRPTTAVSSTTCSRRTSVSRGTTTCAPTPPPRSWRKLRPVFGKGEGATMTAGNSTPLTDGASMVLLGSDEWADEHRSPARPLRRRARPPPSTTSTATRAC